MFWFNPSDERTLFIDKRIARIPIDRGTPGTIGRKPIVVRPDLKADFSNLPLKTGSFNLVVFDPPHMDRSHPKSIMSARYGFLEGDWKDEIKKGFKECFRVLKPGGTLIFKWAETSFPLTEVLKLTKERPLFGHKSGKRQKTHWVSFMKNEDFSIKISLSREV
jgi:SAM-dependent methyltransferase